jgi:hypothetical protein
MTGDNSGTAASQPVTSSPDIASSGRPDRYLRKQSGEYAINRDVLNESP